MNKKLGNFNFILDWSYSWVNGLLRLGKERSLNEADIPEVNQEIVHRIREKLENRWEEKVKVAGSGPLSPSLSQTIYETFFWYTIFPLGILRFVSDMGTNISPIILRLLIDFSVRISLPSSKPALSEGYIFNNKESDMLLHCLESSYL
jgi:hypothetical protein